MDAAAEFVKLSANPHYQRNECISAFECAAHMTRDKDNTFLQTCLDKRRLTPECQFQILTSSFGVWMDEHT